MNPFSRRGFLAAAPFALGAFSLRAKDALLPKVPTLDNAIREAAAKAPLKWQFKGKTPADLAAWQKKFRAKLGELLGPHAPPKNFQPKRINRMEFAQHIREEWLLEAEGVPTLPLYLMRPKNAKGKLPILLALHGHGKFGHDAVVGIDHTAERKANIAKANYDYGRQFAERGFLVVAPCLLPFGRRLDAGLRQQPHRSLRGDLRAAGVARPNADGLQPARLPVGAGLRLRANRCRRRPHRVHRPLVRRTHDDAHRGNG
jgi:hypothetical protein